MAKKAKAKAKRRVLVPTWIVRDEDEAYHAIVSHEKPHVVNEEEAQCNDMPSPVRVGDWIVGSGDDAIWGLQLCTGEYELGTEELDHLKPGGGPLKMQLVRA